MGSLNMYETSRDGGSARESVSVSGRVKEKWGPGLVWMKVKVVSGSSELLGRQGGLHLLNEPC